LVFLARWQTNRWSWKSTLTCPALPSPVGGKRCPTDACQFSSTDCRHCGPSALKPAAGGDLLACFSCFLTESMPWPRRSSPGICLLPGRGDPYSLKGGVETAIHYFDKIWIHGIRRQAHFFALAATSPSRRGSACFSGAFWFGTNRAGGWRPEISPKSLAVSAKNNPCRPSPRQYFATRRAG